MTKIRGCYWRHRGSLFRERPSQLSDDEIRESTTELVVEPSMDVIDAVPLSKIEALGMSVLAGPSDCAESRGSEKTSEDG